jgi:hypothetical protein
MGELLAEELRAERVTCEVCGKQATDCVLDLVEGEPEPDKHGVRWRTWTIGSEHYFCDQHTRKAIKTYRYPPPDGGFTERLMEFEAEILGKVNHARPSTDAHEDP